MASQSPQDKASENPPTVGSGGSDRFSHQMLAICYAGFLAALITVAAYYFSEIIGGDPAFHRSPGTLVLIFTALLGLYVYPKSRGDQLFVFAGLAIVAVWIFAGWHLGLVTIERGTFGQLGDLQYALVLNLLSIGFMLPAYIVFLRIARHRGIRSTPRGQSDQPVI